MKYLDMILKAWGDWALFQTLLNVLRQIGDRHNGASIANVATRWVLDHSFVGAVLIGMCLLDLLFHFIKHSYGVPRCPTRAFGTSGRKSAGVWF